MGTLFQISDVLDRPVAISSRRPRTAAVSWTEFDPRPPREILVRAKPKASPTWSILTTEVSRRARSFLATDLLEDTVYEFQPIGTDPHGRLVAFGSVAEATTLDHRRNFGNAYGNWQNEHPSVGPASADRDGDGLANLVEYALDLDPFTASAAPVTAIALQNGQFSFRYSRRADAYVRWTYDSSENLSQWIPLLELADYTETVTPTGAGMEVVEVTLVAPAASREFVRLSAQPLP